MNKQRLEDYTNWMEARPSKRMRRFIFRSHIRKYWKMYLILFLTGFNIGALIASLFKLDH